jgi:glycosyltransferase involved in cell wall biosynthesis
VKPFASVIVATRNREVLLGHTLDALADQDWPSDRVEVIVADNGSTDRTREAVERAARRRGVGAIRYLHVAAPGKSHAVNAAFSHARGDLFALTDDDVRPSRDWLTQLLRPFEGEEIDFVAGRIEPDWETSPPRWMSPALYGVLAIPDGGSARLAIRLGVNDHVMPIGANMAVRASVIHRLGGLRTDLGKLEGTLRTGEDHELFLRLLHEGLRGCYQPAAVVSHRVHSERLHRAYFRRWLFQNGQDVAKLQKTYRQPGKRLLKVPRGLWRDAAQAGWRGIAATVAGDSAGRFAASVRLIWIAGYLRESWVRDGVHHTAAGDIGIVARHTAPMG